MHPMNIFTSMWWNSCRHHHYKCSFDACWVPASHPSPCYRLCHCEIRCSGRYIRGSGLHDALIEAGVFGKRTLIFIPTGCNYSRSIQSMLVVIEVTDALSWEVFFVSNDPQFNDLMQLQVLLGEKNAEVARTAFLQVF